MAKEKFERTKPHVNVGTIGHVQQIDGPAGLTFDSTESTVTGNPPESYLLTIEATSAFASEPTTVVIPIDDEFFFRLGTGPAESIEFSIDVLPQVFTGSGDLDVSLGILQGEFYLAKETSDLRSTKYHWGESRSGAHCNHQEAYLLVTLKKWMVVQGNPDFNRPFQFGYCLHEPITDPAH